MISARSVFRLLIVEDNAERIAKLRSWLPQDVVTVVATSAGRAIGIMHRDRGRTYAGILLDHDLQESVVTDADKGLSGGDVLKSLIAHISRDVPILVHSMNPFQGPAMAERLERAGFYVTRIPMSELSLEKFQEWLEEVRLLWEDLRES